MKTLSKYGTQTRIVRIFNFLSLLDLIDALEIFSGIIIFSDARAEDKIRFLFDLFDYNSI